MIILIGGVPCSGKSTLMRRLISRLEEPTLIEPKKLFKCQEHGDVLVVGQYPEGETFGGTDKLSHGSIPQFREFIEWANIAYKHVLIEGDRYFRGVDIEWLMQNHEALVYVLTVDISEEHNRHTERGDTQSEVWLKGRRTQINNILTNMNLLGQLNIRDNNSIETSMRIEEEIHAKIIR